MILKIKISVKECSDEIGASILWPFKVVHAFDDSHDIYFSAAVESDLKKWTEVIKKEINYANHKKLSNKHRNFSGDTRKQASGETSPTNKTAPTCTIKKQDGHRQETKEKVQPPSGKPHSLSKSLTPKSQECPFRADTSASKKTFTTFIPKNIDQLSDKKVTNERQLLYEPVSFLTVLFICIRLQINSMYMRRELQVDEDDPDDVSKRTNVLASSFWTGDADEGKTILSTKPIGAFMIRKSNTSDTTCRKSINTEDIISQFNKVNSALPIFPENEAFGPNVVPSAPIAVTLHKKGASSNNITLITLLVRVNAPSPCTKYKIFETESGLIFMDSKEEKFESLISMLKYYTENNLPGRDEKLFKPYSEID
ncbi:hypothetical protein HELRODRAFT_167021 [Helobdella robusta]|uniref:SH2 domain-containing protein n=1 Tax=Helobdella robusta TaxID=6412 RepID=T1EYW7_HELRO|nr:hypothetical protein HELRODRAFT_167021 [Helobdella robusta]ESO11926.1 hypothetical protein HELRODRAFT_167021 [Helobdella robusta]